MSGELGGNTEVSDNSMSESLDNSSGKETSSEFEGNKISGNESFDNDYDGESKIEFSDEVNPEGDFVNNDNAQGEKQIEFSNEVDPEVDFVNNDNPQEEKQIEFSDEVDPNQNSDVNNDIGESNLKENEVGDDNGKAYMRDGKLIPNNEYDLNGYHYTTDEKGRIIKAEGLVKIPDNIEPRQNLPYLKDRGPTDDRGHVFARELGGSNSIGNLVPMDSELNEHGDYRKFEREIKQMVDEGKDVKVTILCHYDDNSSRPTSFTVSYEVDGEITERTFLNK